MLVLRFASFVALVAAAAGLADVKQISHSGAGAYEASFAPFGDGFAVTWYDTRHGRPELFARLIHDTGEPSSPELRLSLNRPAYEPDVAVSGSDLVVGWYETDPQSTFRAMLGGWSTKGRRLWTRQLSQTDRYGRSVVVRADGERIFAAWLEESADASTAVRAQWFDGSGQPRGKARTIAPAGKTTWNLNASIDRTGRSWVAFDAHVDTRADELFLVSVDEEGSRTVRLTRDDGAASKYPDVAISEDGSAALTWFDERDGNREVYLVVAPPTELADAVEARAARITNTPGETIGAYVAWNRDRIGLAWCDNTAGHHEIYFESFDARGGEVDAARRVTSNSTDSLIPAIRPSGDGFALVWNDVTPGPSGGHDPHSKSEIAFARIPARSVN